MQTDARLGTFDDVTRNSTLPIAAIANTLRELIAKVYPAVIELPRPAEQHASYAVGPGKSAQVFGYLCPMQDYVRLGFYFGGALPDPTGLLVGTGKRLRHVKIYSIAEAQQPAVRRLIDAAVKERKKALGLK